jgi:hypothetical protein
MDIRAFLWILYSNQKLLNSLDCQIFLTWTAMCNPKRVRDQNVVHKLNYITSPHKKRVK